MFGNIHLLKQIVQNKSFFIVANIWMFDYKIIFFIIPLIIVLVLAYKEISSLKKNIEEINHELKRQTTVITSNVDQCVNRIEQISKIHITELQNINAINAQRINKLNRVSSNRSRQSHNNEGASSDIDGLSRQYMSQLSQDNTCNTHNDMRDIDNTSENVDIPIYEPAHEPAHKIACSHDGKSDANLGVLPVEIVSQDCDDKQGTEEEIICGVLPSGLSSTNVLNSVLGILSMRNNTLIDLHEEMRARPIIESASDTVSVLEMDIQSRKVPMQVSDKCITPEQQIVNADKNSETVSQSSKTSRTSKASQTSKTSRTSKISRTSKASQVSKAAHEENINSVPSSHVQPKTIDEYTIVELKDIAKARGISTYIKIDGKTRQCKKSELYNALRLGTELHI